MGQRAPPKKIHFIVVKTHYSTQHAPHYAHTHYIAHQENHTNGKR